MIIQLAQAAIFEGRRPGFIPAWGAALGLEAETIQGLKARPIVRANMDRAFSPIDPCSHRPWGVAAGRYSPGLRSERLVACANRTIIFGQSYIYISERFD